MCNRHAIRANVNKASKQAKRGECLSCERLVQGTRHVGKKALQYFFLIEIWKSEVQGWNLSKIFGILTSGLGHNDIASNELWNTETQKTDRNPPITNHKQWPFEPAEENFRFLRGPLRWLTSDIFLTRGSKCANHRKTVLIACFLWGHLNLLLSLFYVHFLFFILWLVDFV